MEHLSQTQTVDAAIRSRMSVRAFTGHAVPRADIEAKIREEFEIKKRVEEEMQRQKQQLLQ